MSDDDYKLRLAVIAGASRALQERKKNWRATDEEILRSISDNMQDILEKVGSEA